MIGVPPQDLNGKGESDGFTHWHSSFLGAFKEATSCSGSEDVTGPQEKARTKLVKHPNRLAPDDTYNH